VVPAWVLELVSELEGFELESGGIELEIGFGLELGDFKYDCQSHSMDWHVYCCLSFGYSYQTSLKTGKSVMVSGQGRD